MPPRICLLWAIVFVLLRGSWAQEQPPAEPPEEDELLVQKEYSFNPLQARKEVQIGNFYFRKGSYRAAASRFLEATRWDENMAEAYLRLGQTYDKLKEDAAARKAFEKYLALAPKGGEAKAIRKRLSRKP